MRAPLPCVPGSLVVMCMVVYSVWYVIVVHLSGAEEEVSVSNLRSSVSHEGLYIVAVPRSQNPPPRTSAPTPSELEPPPPRARILPRPEHPTAEDPRDKHPHPPTCCARQQISREPTMEPSKALSRVTIVPSHPPAKHPDRVSSWDVLILLLCCICFYNWIGKVNK
ncbi:hypothetical protein DPMN_001772 [Dreissena polymorpha]|uniref:Uncharacterized protein n=1 Tax=Dreissena polymorpha TaxID=45954 RepID=A0A9D4RTC6_DREPO|nr:hypothetical protein DPMN_001772 [Dreissena polymorpha]